MQGVASTSHCTLLVTNLEFILGCSVRITSGISECEVSHCGWLLNWPHNNYFVG